MASVTGKTAAKEGGDWDSLIVTKASNGLSIKKCFDYRPGGKQPADVPPYLATSLKEAVDYFEHCAGAVKFEESDAEEKAEEKSGKKSASGKY